MYLTKQLMLRLPETWSSRYAHNDQLQTFSSFFHIIYIIHNHYITSSLFSILVSCTFFLSMLMLFIFLLGWPRVSLITFLLHNLNNLINKLIKLLTGNLAIPINIQLPKNNIDIFLGRILNLERFRQPLHQHSQLMDLNRTRFITIKPKKCLSHGFTSLGLDLLVLRGWHFGVGELYGFGGI